MFMFCKFLLAVSLSLSLLSAASAETLEIDYTYRGEHGVDFSTMPGGPLSIAQFSDVRDGDNTHAITGLHSGDGENQRGYRTTQAIHELLRSALVKGFAAGGAELVDDGEKLLLTGELTDASGELKDGEVEISLRAKVALKNSQSGSQLFTASLFGRASASQEEGPAAAFSKAMDKLVNSLLWDDYFLMHVID